MLGITRRVKKSEDGSETVEYSDRLGMALLTAHRASAMAARPGAREEGENAREWLARKLAEMNRRLRGDEAE